MGREESKDLTSLEILGCMQGLYGIPSAQEEDALGRLELPMDHNDTPEVTILAIIQVQLFFLGYPEGVCKLTDVQLICQGVKQLRACGPLYGTALII